MEPKVSSTKFKPGQGGRPKGAVNKLTKETKQRVEWVLEMLEESLEESIEKLKPTEKVRLWADLQEYVRPKLQRMNLDVGTEDKTINKIIFEVVTSGGSSSAGSVSGATGSDAAGSAGGGSIS